MPVPLNPIIMKFEFESLRQTVLHALSPEAIRNNVIAAIDKAIAEYDFDTHVREELDWAVRDSVKAYFHYGEGNKKIKEILGQQITKAFLKGD